ncbi:DUF2924 domain-containing protein [Chenggangzhangella methanolivorans]|uniref:DUF2924 domain-containing protein n=1 Tax=Chenggangzhangella methanolivorans TaxID=1437009 RepID=A0A9E6RGW2_9HYPH|nr:DUF2924 domain-containing protein [Chenggangzhangella methanolivorans]QZO01236.1 DUF2924 domain-containing protein [Chenggangzhangella methanolivorans]
MSRTPGIEVELRRLETLDFTTLKARWRSVTGRAAPTVVTRSLLLKLLAYRVQADALGDLDPDTARFLDRVATDRKFAKAKSLPMPDKVRAGQGAIFIREWEGVTHHVMHIADGYAWNGATYRSLSEVARAITGVRWNGPRFFGLRARENVR